MKQLNKIEMELFKLIEKSEREILDITELSKLKNELEEQLYNDLDVLTKTSWGEEEIYSKPDFMSDINSHLKLYRKVLELLTRLETK